jgi:hypothetical protein
MKKLIVTLGLAAAVVSSLFAASPVRAAEEEPTLMPSMPIPSSVQLKPILPLGPQYLTLLPRAELISRVTVTPYPGQPAYRLVYCKVSNIGHKNTGPFKTLVRIHRKIFPWLPAVASQVNVGIWNIPPGGHQWIVLKAKPYFGITKAFSFADSTYTVPEYNEANNFDLWP